MELRLALDSNQVQGPPSVERQWTVFVRHLSTGIFHEADPEPRQPDLGLGDACLGRCGLV